MRHPPGFQSLVLHSQRSLLLLRQHLPPPRCLLRSITAAIDTAHAHRQTPCTTSPSWQALLDITLGTSMSLSVVPTISSATLMAAGLVASPSLTLACVGSTCSSRLGIAALQVICSPPLLCSTTRLTRLVLRSSCVKAPVMRSSSKISSVTSSPAPNAFSPLALHRPLLVPAPRFLDPAILKASLMLPLLHSCARHARNGSAPPLATDASDSDSIRFMGSICLSTTTTGTCSQSFPPPATSNLFLSWPNGPLAALCRPALPPTVMTILMIPRIPTRSNIMASTSRLALTGAFTAAVTMAVDAPPLMVASI